MDALVPPRLPGLLVRRPLGQTVDPPWLAKADDGSWVVVRKAPRPPDLPDHPALLTVYGSVTDAEACTWVVTEFTSGNGLDRRLERVSRVGARQATVWCAVLADAVAALHAAGLAHGDLRPSRVLLGPGDAVLLDASCAAPGGAADRTADLAALAALIEQAAGDPLAGPVADLLAAAATGAIDAAGLVRGLGVRGAGRPRDRRAPVRHASRGLLIGAAVVVLLAGAAGLGVRLAAAPAEPAVLAVADTLSASPEASMRVTTSSSQPVTTPEPDSTATPERPAGVDPDWQAVLVDLDLARGLALETADVAILDDVDAAGSEALRRDRALVGAMHAQHVTAEGWATELIAVVPRSVALGRVVLVVTDTRSAYVLRNSSGAVVDRQPERGPTTWVVRLVRSEVGWRIRSVDQLPAE